MRHLIAFLGIVSLILGIVGIILPVLPTTPFLLLSAFCFGKSSERLHSWLLNHRWFGETIRNYQDGLGLRRIVKIRAIALVWISISASATFGADIIYVRILLFIIAISVSIYLLKLPTLR